MQAGRLQRAAVRACSLHTSSSEDAPRAEGQAEEGGDGAGEGEGSRRGWGCGEPGFSGSRGKAGSAALRCSGLSLPPSGAGVVRRACCSLPARCPRSSRPVFLMGFGRCPAPPGSRSAGLKARAPWGERAGRGCGAGQEHRAVQGAHLRVPAADVCWGFTRVCSWLAKGDIRVWSLVFIGKLKRSTDERG